MEDNNNYDNSNEQKQSAASTPYLSKRGQYNPALKQPQQNSEGYTSTGQAFDPQYAEQTQYNSGHHSTPPYANPYPYGQQQASNGPLKHSGLGISSFIISLVAIVISVICIVLVFAGTADLISENSTQFDSLQDPNEVTNMLNSGTMPEGFGMIMGGVLLIFLSMGLSFIGGILGLIAVFQKNRKKVFSILGLIFNVCVFIGFILLFLIGLVIGAGI